MLGHWLAICHGDADLAVATLARLGRQGHLSDKPMAYFTAALERDALAASRAAIPPTPVYEDDEDDDVYVVRARPAAGRA